MKKVLKWIGLGMGVFMVLLVITSFILKSKFINLEKRRFTYGIPDINIPADSASITRGLILSVGCRDCHGLDLSGKDFFNDPSIGYMSSPNITRGKGSATEQYNDKDWIRTFRHGIDPTGRPLMTMPSESIGQLSDRDLSCLIAYLKSIKPIDKGRGPTHFTFMAQVLAGAGMFGNLYPQDIINHQKVNTIASIPISDKPEYGEYVSRYFGCKTCHGAKLNGFISPDPSAPPCPNITFKGNPGKWTSNQFIQTMRTGTTPEGKILDAKYMPWPALAAHSDVEIEAVYNFLKSIPAMENNAAYDKKIKSIAKK